MTQPAADYPARRGALTPRTAIVLLCVAFWSVSSVTWDQQVSSTELNRNDAAYYLLLAKNVVRHGVYSDRQAPPYIYHAVWPPGVPIVYTPPMLLAGEGPLGPAKYAVHAWVLLVATAGIFALHRYLRYFVSAGPALLVTVASVLSRHHLTCAQAALAEMPAFAATFWVLAEIEHHFRAANRSRWRSRGLYLALAALPLVKPYLGLVFAVFLVQLFRREPRRGAGEKLRGVAVLGAACLPFLAFLIYTEVVSSRYGTVGALTWLSSNNPVEVDAKNAEPRARSLEEWIAGAYETVKFHLVYHVTTSPLPVLTWLQVPGWPLGLRIPAMLLIAALMARGAISFGRNGDWGPSVFSGCLFLFFIAFACDSPRYFVPLVPIFALFFCEGVRAVTPPGRSSIVLSALSVAVLVSAGACAAFWIHHRAGMANDPDPEFNDIYAALEWAAASAGVEEIVVPYPLRETAIVETGKRVLTYEDYESAAGREDARSTAVLLLEKRGLLEHAKYEPTRSVARRLESRAFRTLFANSTAALKAAE